MTWSSLSSELREALEAVATPEEIRTIRKEPVATPEGIALQQRIIDKVREQSNHALSVELLNFVLYQKQETTAIGPQHPSTLETMFDLASELGAMGRYAEAEDVWIQLLALYKSLGIDDNLKVMYNLAMDYNHEKKYAEAEELLKQVLPQLRARIGKDSQQAIGTLRALSVAIGRQGRYEEAEKLNSQGLRELEENSSIPEEDKMAHTKGLERVRADLEVSARG